MRSLAFVVFSILLAVLEPSRLAAQEYVDRTPPRLSLIDGRVSFWPSGARDWEGAELNLPLGPGDYLRTGSASRAELQIGARAFLRLAEATEIGIDEQTTDYVRCEVVDGRIALDLRRMLAGGRAHVRTPHATLAIYEPGFYEVIVTADRSSFLAHRGGSGTVFDNGDFEPIRSGEEIVRRGTSSFERYEAPPFDAFARWNLERTDAIEARLRDDVVSDDIYGLADLNEHGRWYDEPEYGRIWVPLRVGPGWRPYSTGRWYWDVGYGWTWVDTAPWGWAPYHYGRWVRCRRGWAWAPGPNLRPVYAPALVAFLHEPGIAIGIGGPVSWVALDWGEPVLPWWGPTWYQHRPCWDGWGGPAYVHRHRVKPHHKYDHHDIPRYRHQDTPDAVVVVDRRDFGRRPSARPHAPRIDGTRLRPAEQPPAQPVDVGLPPRGERTRPPRPERSTGTTPQSPRSNRPEYGGGERSPRRDAPRPQPREAVPVPRDERPVRGAPRVPGDRYERTSPQPTEEQRSPYDRRERDESSRSRDARRERPAPEDLPRRVEPDRRSPETLRRTEPYGGRAVEPRREPYERREPSRRREESEPMRAPVPHRPEREEPRAPRIERESRPERHAPVPMRHERSERPQESMRPSRGDRDRDSDDGGERAPRGGGASRPQRIEPPSP